MHVKCLSVDRKGLTPRLILLETLVNFVILYCHEATLQIPTLFFSPINIVHFKCLCIVIVGKLLVYMT